MIRYGHKGGQSAHPGRMGTRDNRKRKTRTSDRGPATKMEAWHCVAGNRFCGSVCWRCSVSGGAFTSRALGPDWKEDSVAEYGSFLAFCVCYGDVPDPVELSQKY